MTTDAAWATPAGARLELESSGPVLLFDHHRTPYSVTGPPRSVEGSGLQVGWIGDAVGSARLHWVSPGAATPCARWSAGDVPIVSRVATDAETTPVLRSLGGSWDRLLTVTPAGDGNGPATVWTRTDGSVLLPFDPDEAISNLWTEAYLEALNPVMEQATSLGRRAYYRVKPLMPRALQIAFRRVLARRQARTQFPRWPVEPALHDLYDLLFGLVAKVIGQPVPTIAPWPTGHTWALVLTHDVETDAGLAGIAPLRDAERRHGLVSEWNFVPERYHLPDSLRADLERQGCEIGVHGLLHDGHDLESPATLAARLPAIRRYADAWQATGFRAPSMQRSWEAMRGLGFDHDLSFPDTDPFQPCRGGCCSWWPLMNGPVVELPLTLPQDHTLFVILRRSGPQVWLDKTSLLRDRGGMAQILVHPDYIDVPGVLSAYEELLATFAKDSAVWHALPHEVSTWWRARAASTIVAGAAGWEVAGPAAPEASVVLIPRT